MRTVKTLLVTRPNYDPTTHYCFHWSQPVIDFAKAKLYRILDLQYGKVSKSNFESYLQKQKPDLLFLNGHGSEKELAGQNGNPIFIGTELSVYTRII